MADYERHHYDKELLAKTGKQLTVQYLRQVLIYLIRSRLQSLTRSFENYVNQSGATKFRCEYIMLTVLALDVEPFQKGTRKYRYNIGTYTLNHSQLSVGLTARGNL